jgi:hypothetical protein
VGRHKGDPEFARSVHYYAAVSQWFDRLSLDDQERVHTAVYVYSTPGYGGEKAAVTYDLTRTGNWLGHNRPIKCLDAEAGAVANIRG